MRENVKMIELTNELFKELKPEDFIAITMAEGGAMGDPGAIEIADKDLNFYYTHFGEVDDKILEDKIPFLKTVQIKFGDVIGLGDDWDWLNTGFGNYLFIRPEYKEPLLKYINDNYSDSSTSGIAELYLHWHDGLIEIVKAKNDTIVL